jgi:MoaA/NifB/PqqE/SkfB family radical SAM enzyme
LFSNDIFIVERYKFDNSTDYEILKKFINDVSGKYYYYYAPKPNIYENVDFFSFIYLSKKFGAPFLKLIFPFFKKRLIDFVTSHFRHKSKILKKFYYQAAKFWNYILKLKSNYKKSRKNGDVIIQEAKQLDEFGEFKFWDPPKSYKYRDLIEKVDYFYPAPRGIHVVLLNKCNAACIMCPYFSPKYTPYHKSDFFKGEVKLMDEKIFRKVASYAGKYKVALQFGEVEEPLMHHQFPKFVEIAKKEGVPYTYVSTNGILLDERKSEALIKAGIDILKISINSTSEEGYTKIFGRNFKQRVYKNLENFLKMSRGTNIEVGASFIIQPPVENEKDDFIRIMKSMGVDWVTIYRLVEHNLEDGSISFQEVYNRNERYTCSQPWVVSVVFPDGEVSICCKAMTDIGWHGIVEMGNINKQSFEEIWSGREYSQLRREQIDNDFKKFKLCINCQGWSSTTYYKKNHNGYLIVYNESTEIHYFKRSLEA